VYYLWSWGDSISSWLGPYDSGAVAEATHSWTVAGDYLVKVKAKNTHELESSWSEPILVHIETSPCIEIGEISGGLGVTAEIKNTGAGEATNITWSIAIDGGLVLLGRQTIGALLKIQPGFSPTVKSGLLFGFGSITIVVTAESAEKTAQAMLLGPFVLIKK